VAAVARAADVGGLEPESEMLKLRRERGRYTGFLWSPPFSRPRPWLAYSLPGSTPGHISWKPPLPTKLAGRRARRRIRALGAARDVATFKRTTGRLSRRTRRRMGRVCWSRFDST